MPAAWVGAGAAVLGAGSSLLGGGSGSGGSSQTDNAPWSAQQPYLTQGFQNAQDLYDQRTAQNPNGYTGSLYSPINDIQTSNANAAAYNAGGVGQNLYNTTGQTAQTLQSGAGNYMNNATNLAANGVGGINPAYTNTQSGYATGALQAQGPTAGLSSALNSAGISGAQAIQNGQSTLQNAAATAGQDQTGNTINSAGQYMNNGVLNGQIAAAQQTNNDTLNEVTTPGLNRAASMGGNLNSSRAGMAEAMANRDTANANANIDATMRGNAYNNGLSLAAQQQEAGVNQQIAAGTAQANNGASTALGTAGLQQNQGQFNATTQLGAANAGAATQLGNLGLNAQTQLGANAQLGSGVNSGVNAANSAGTQAQQNLITGQTAGSVLQNDQNAQLQNAYQQWQNQNGSYQQGLLNSYFQAINNGNGGTSTTTSTLPSNTMGNALGGAAAGYGLYKSGAFSGLFGQTADQSAAAQYANPYGATGSGQMIVGSNGMMGGGV